MRLCLLALLAASCSYDAENASIFVHVDGIPQQADHLNVVVTPSDTSVAGKNNCGAEVTVASSVTCYRPSFQPGALPGGAIDLAFSAPASAGTFTVAITASDRQLTQLAQGSIPTTSLPGPVNLQVTLH
jgi:hypothetical protein